MAANLALPYTHTAGAPQDASQFMANLNAIITWFVSNVAQLDGSKAMTGQLTGPNLDPATSAQYARKSYVDALITAEASARSTADASPTRHGCQAKRAAVQSIPSGSETLVIFDTETYDTDAMFAPGGTTVTIPVGGTGRYAVFVCAQMTTTAFFTGNLKVNGSTVMTIGGLADVNGTNYYAASTYFATLNAGDLVTFTLTQNAGSSKNATATLIVHRLGAS
jgi:hypothetical protein